MEPLSFRSHPPEPHPSRPLLDQASLGLLDEPTLSSLRTHLDLCPSCRQRSSRLLDERSSFASSPIPPALRAILSPLDPDSKTAGSLAPPPKVLQARQTPRSIVRLPWLWRGAFVSLLAFFAFVELSTPPPPNDSFSLKGHLLHPRPSAPPSLDVYLEREGRVTQAISASSFHDKDRLAFAYKASGFRYLALWIKDAQGTVSWLYPDTPETCLPLAAQGQLLGSIELDPAQGTEVLHAIFLHQPASASELRSLASSPPSPGFFPLPKDRPTAPSGFAWTFVLHKVPRQAKTP